MIAKQGEYLIPFQINATDVAAHTAQQFVSPCDGFIDEFAVVVQVAVSTGGTVKVKILTVDVVGASVTTVASDAAGVAYNASVSGGQIAMAAPTAKITKGAVFQVYTTTMTGGSCALNGYVRIVGGA